MYLICVGFSNKWFFLQEALKFNTVDARLKIVIKKKLPFEEEIFWHFVETNEILRLCACVAVKRRPREL